MGPGNGPVWNFESRAFLGAQDAEAPPVVIVTQFVAQVLSLKVLGDGA